MREKRLFSIPAKFIELLWSDPDFFAEVSRIKKVTNTWNFPKSDQWNDDAGLHMNFALAGYSPDDIRITVEGNLLIINSAGIDDIKVVESPEEIVETTEDRERKVKIHYGLISRGIARRSFDVKFVIADEFNLSKIHASMKCGLLDLTIPHREEKIEPIFVKIEKE